jgi:hypothetical protein
MFPEVYLLYELGYVTPGAGILSENKFRVCIRTFEFPIGVYIWKVC